MPDILIRGMEMPENEPLRLVLNPNGQLFVDHGVTFTEYEAVELPEHGDLIDRDEYVKSECNSCDGSCECVECDCLNCEQSCRCDVIIDAMNAPVIVPSNKEKSE